MHVLRKCFPLLSREAVRSRCRFIGWFLISGTALGAMPVLAQAQDGQSVQSDPASAAIRLEEVVVTATKRQETVLKVPLSITVLSPTDLERSGVASLANLTSMVPGLEINSVSLANSIQVTMRGITDTNFNETGNPAISTYVDGVYVGRTEGLAGDLYDLARIEVLHGPQGTLYGRNSTGGNINIITADPEKHYDAASSVSYGNYNDVMIHGMLNVPLTSSLAVRAAFIVHRNDGYYDTIGTTAQNYGAANDFGGRVTALWEPTDSFRWRIAVDDFVEKGTPGLDFDTGPDGRPTDGLPIYRRPVSSTPEPFDHLTNFMIRSKMDLAMGGGFSLTYVAGYQEIRSKVQFSVSNNSFSGLRPDSTNSYSHELDWNYEVGAWRNILGANYFDQLVTSADAYDLWDDELTFTSAGRGHSPRVPSSAWGVFDQATYSVTRALRLTGAVRYSSERQAEDPVTEVFCPIAQFGAVPLTELTGLDQADCLTLTQGLTKGSWSDISWKGIVAYDLSERTSTYVSVSTGFKSGGINPGISNPATFLPEKVTDYEWGLKSQSLGHAAAVNLALFYEKYKDLQVTQIAATSTVTANAASAPVYGVELNGQWAISTQDTLSGFVNYLHATYGSYSNALDAQTGAVYPSLSGKTLPNSPRYSARVEYAHNFNIGDGGTISPRAAVYWQSTSYLREFDLPIDKVDSYTKTDLSMAYTDPSGKWELAGYVDNLENKAVRNSSYVAVGRYLSDYSPPRTFGLRLSYKH